MVGWVLLTLQTSLPFPSASSPASSQRKFSEGITWLDGVCLYNPRYSPYVKVWRLNDICQVPFATSPNIATDSKDEGSVDIIGENFLPTSLSSCANEHILALWNEANLLDVWAHVDGGSWPILLVEKATVRPSSHRSASGKASLWCLMETT